MTISVDVRDDRVLQNSFPFQCKEVIFKSTNCNHPGINPSNLLVNHGLFTSDQMLVLCALGIKKSLLISFTIIEQVEVVNKALLSKREKYLQHQPRTFEDLGGNGIFIKTEDD